jgi:CDP-paratose 2-epimerase|tara:strand:- start:369 stop:1415 length:1047 start_codon:yes stop_codon:yes gene_type:complete
MKILITGGAGFVGSHAAEYYAKKGDEVVVLDNLSRSKSIYSKLNPLYNWDYLKKYENIGRINADITNSEEIEKFTQDIDAIIHTAGQVAVTPSINDPRQDFKINAQGTFNVLEAARKSKNHPAVVYCSTNKVYGENINSIPLKEGEWKYQFKDKKFLNGIPTGFPIDLTEHTPYGCSKLCGDIYAQDYGLRNEVATGIFRMSCIYGTRQFGAEEQGWLVHFIISTLFDIGVTIYGDGKQVRDVLFVSDLIAAFDSFIKNRDKLSGQVFNIGGGSENTLSLLELLNIIEKETGKRSNIHYDDWRPSDQKVYISDISKAKDLLSWSPRISAKKGIKKSIQWIKDNEAYFK